MRTLITIFLIGTCAVASSGQTNQTLLWQFSADPVRNGRTVLKMTAILSPGWHLYSQFIGEGGPVPTRFTFENADGLVLIGTLEEKGRPFTFHDDTYEMDITWYSDRVDFCQEVSIHAPIASIAGKVEFMTCNAHICIPDERKFVIKIPYQTKNDK